MELTLNKKMLLTEHEKLHVDASDSEENTILVKTMTGNFKITGNGTVVFIGKDDDEASGEVIHRNGMREPGSN